MPNILTYVLLLIAVYVAAFTDLRTKTIPIWLFPTAGILVLILRLFYVFDGWIDCIVASIIMGVVYFLSAMFFHGGGGDIIMMSVIGWCVGFEMSVNIALVSNIVFLLIILLRSKKWKKSWKTMTLPYAPSVAIGVCVILAFTIVYNN